MKILYILNWTSLLICQFCRSKIVECREFHMVLSRSYVSFLINSIFRWVGQLTNGILCVYLFVCLFYNWTLEMVEGNILPKNGQWISDINPSHINFRKKKVIYWHIPKKSKGNLKTDRCKGLNVNKITLKKSPLLLSTCSPFLLF